MAEVASYPSFRSILKEDPDSPTRVLISWSPRSTGTEAIEFAAWLSKTFPIEVQVVSTLYQPWATTSLSKLGGKYKKLYKREQASTAQRVREELERAGINDKQWAEQESVLVDGPNRPALLTQVAKDFNADLILLGPNQAAPKGRFFAGSTADSLLHYSPLPLGLVPRDIKLSKNGLKRVNFIFTEHSTDRDPSLLAAGYLAKRAGRPLRLLAFSPDGLMAASSSPSLDVATQLTKNWREHTLAMLDRACDRLEEELGGIEVSTEIGTGNGWAGAIESRKWKKGDVVCMASVPQGPLERVFLGSTATEMLPHLSVPILVRPADR